MKYSVNREILKNTIMIMISILILFLSFQIQYNMINFKNAYIQRVSESISDNIQINELLVTMRAIGLSLVIALVNFLLRLIVCYSTKYL